VLWRSASRFGCAKRGRPRVCLSPHRIGVLETYGLLSSVEMISRVNRSNEPECCSAYRGGGALGVSRTSAAARPAVTAEHCSLALCAPCRIIAGFQHSAHVCDRWLGATCSIVRPGARMAMRRGEPHRSAPRGVLQGPLPPVLRGMPWPRGRWGGRRHQRGRMALVACAACVPGAFVLEATDWLTTQGTRRLEHARTPHH